MDDRAHRARVIESADVRFTLESEDGTELRLDGVDAAVLLAVPQAKIGPVAQWLLPRLGPDSVVFDLASEKSSSIAAMSKARPELAVFGTHPLFSYAVGSVYGQTLIICPSLVDPDAHEWLSVAVDEAGGTVKTTTAERHDVVMAYVQTAAHQALVVFADVIGTSGRDLEEDLWSLRTPQFETLLAMASRVLVTEQVETIASIQLSTSGDRVVDEMGEALERLRTVIRSDSLAAIEAHLDRIGALYPGSLFHVMQEASNVATAAVQASRASLARLRQTGELIAVSPKNNPDKLRVGCITGLTTTTLEIENLLVGKKGNARLLGHNEHFGAKLGISGNKSSVRFSIGNVDLFLGPELDNLLDRWLASVSVYVSLIGPESVSGRAMCFAASGHPIVRDAELVADEVRFGQRQYLLRCFVRADRDPSNLTVELQSRCDAIYEWPPPVVAVPDSPGGSGMIGYLGPPGTFSESAAAAVKDVAQSRRLELAPFGDFEKVLDALRTGEVDIAVLPLCNSATGLVEEAAASLRACEGNLAGCGVVDVPIRFDAFGRDGESLKDAKVLISQAQALKQCRRFIDEHQLEEKTSSSTIEALEKLADGEGDLALAPAGSRAPRPVEIVQSNVGDLRGAITRFIVLRNADAARPEPAVGIDGEASGDPRTRTVWLLSSSQPIPPSRGTATFDEIIEGEGGLRLVVSTDPFRVPAGSGVRCLGSFLWTPRTPTITV